MRSGPASSIKMPKDPVTDRRVTDRGALFWGHTDRDELLDRTVIGRQHTESSVPGTGDLDRELDDALQHRVERELRSEDHACLDQSLVALARRGAPTSSQRTRAADPGVDRTLDPDR